jgi:hypothetical protein
VLHGKLSVGHRAVHRRKNLRRKVTKRYYSALDVVDSLPLEGQVLHSCLACAS